MAHLNCTGDRGKLWKCCVWKYPEIVAQNYEQPSVRTAKEKVTEAGQAVNPHKQCATCRGSFLFKCIGNRPSESQQVGSNPDWIYNPLQQTCLCLDQRSLQLKMWPEYSNGTQMATTDTWWNLKTTSMKRRSTSADCKRPKLSRATILPASSSTWWSEKNRLLQNRL